MTDYIEEMMKTAGVEERPHCYNEYAAECLPCEQPCEECSFYAFKIPDFTPEKQLEIIKLIFKKCFIDIQNNKINFSYYDAPITYNMDSNDFAQNLAALVNNIWKNFTKLEKEKIKGILEG